MDTTYAKRTDGKLIKAERGIDRTLPFFCPGCKQEVYAATEGRKQRPHFRHKSLDGRPGCSEPESYVHWITKELFAEEYQKLKEFYLSIGVQEKCVHDRTCSKTVPHTINLKEKYPYIKVEKSDNGFRPDCLLYSSNGNKLYLEVHYTSGISEAKRESGIPIIEVKIYDQHNIDKIVRNGGFTTEKSSIFKKETYYTVELYNEAELLPKDIKSFDCKLNCINGTRFNATSLIPRKSFGKKKTQYGIQVRKVTPPKTNPTEELVDSSKIVSSKDQKAIEYLSHATGRRDRNTKNNKIPNNKRRCIAKYNAGYKLHKHNKVPTGDAVRTLIEHETFIFMCYSGVFFGALRYESKWHIYTVNSDNNKEEIAFIESIDFKEGIKRLIKHLFHIF